LENQWHLSLNQPPTLSKDQLAEPLPTSLPAPNPYNGTTIALLLLGIGLVVVALLGLGSIIAYQRRVRQMALLAQQMQYAPPHIVPSQKGPPKWSRQTGYTPPGNYTSPSSYALPRQPRVQQSQYSGVPSYPPSQRQ
ncbi:MAG TPA: hypothetical protein VGL94_22210, partial [Ktedonobacteraceae bacterium]